MHRFCSSGIVMFTRPDRTKVCQPVRVWTACHNTQLWPCPHWCCSSDWCWRDSTNRNLWLFRFVSKILSDCIVSDSSVPRKVFLKSQISSHGILQDCNYINWRGSYHDSCPVDGLNRKLLHIIHRSVPSQTIENIIKDKTWFSEKYSEAQRDKQAATRWWTRYRTR